MKYLDERIILSVTVEYPYPDAGIYQYQVYEYNESAQSEDDELIYVGNYYYDANSSRIDFDLTDMIRSRKYVTVSNTYTYTTSSIEGNLIYKYKIKVWTSAGSVTSSWEDVAMIYRYPNYKGWFTNGVRTFENVGADDYKVNPALQGSNYMESQYIPHYPAMSTSKYAFNQVFITSTGMQEFQLNFVQSPDLDEDYTISIAQYDSRSTETHILLNDLVDWTYVDSNKDATLYLQPEQDVYIPIAKFDSCMKRYYLQWRDRYGGWQSQGFNNYATYSETFDVTETQNYKNEHYKSNIQVQPKWKINSGWIPEQWFYIYESIFVSPTVILFDTKYNKSYYVMMNTNYTEKTFKDEKKLLNLTLELKEINKQTIIY